MKKKSPDNQRGAVVILLALVMVVLLAVTGLAIDSGIGYGVKAKLNAALDAAALAGARAVATGASDEARQEAAQAAGEKFFAANFPTGWLGATPGTPEISAVHNANGSWTVSASASATVPTTFMHILGHDLLTVTAAAEATRRDLDMELVIDTSGSMGEPPEALDRIKTAASQFVGLFNDDTGGDRIGLVTFSSGAVLNAEINKDASRGFDKRKIQNAISHLSPESTTASEWGMQRAVADMQAIPVELRSSLRVIVFFSDGAPNTIAANFMHNGSPTAAALFSETRTTGHANSSDPARHFYNHNALNDDHNPFGTWNDATTLPAIGLGGVELKSYNDARILANYGSNPSYPYRNTLCNVNKASRNMVENVANSARENNILVFTLGFNGSDRLNNYEIDFDGGDCGYGTEEYGANILQRLANTTAADKSNSAQPRGLCIIFDDPDEAEDAFAQVASEILRLSR